MAATTVVEGTVIEDAPRSRKGLLLALPALVLLAAAGAAAWWFLFSGGEAEPPPPEDGEIVAVDPLTTTVGEAALRHARVGMAVVLAEGVAPEVVEPKVALLEDALLREVAQLDADGLRSAEGSAALRVALTDHAIDIWGEEVVRRVVLTELLVQ